MTAAISTSNLSVQYGENRVLENISLQIPEGQCCGIIGPNGAGKSSFLKAILGLVPATGDVRFFGEKLDKVRLRVAYLPQRENIDWDFPITVEEVALMGRNPHKSLFSRLNEYDKNTAKKALELAGIGDLSKRRISELSGGQQKKVFLARALAQEAELYLLDEPFAGIDAVSEKSLMDILRQLTNSGKTVVMVHHDLQTVRKYFDFIVLLNKTLFAAGNCKENFTQTLIEETYGIKKAFGEEQV